MVAIAEDYTRSLLVEGSEALIDTTHPFRLNIWQAAEERAEATWEAIRKAWNEWHGITLSTAPSHLPFSGFVEARNSIVHGLGELTRRQARTPEALNRTTSRLGHAHLKLSGTRVILESTSILEAVTASIGLVEWLDREAVSQRVVPLR